MGKRIDIAKRLEELGYDPLEGLVRMALAAEERKNTVLAAKIAMDLLQYTAPKLKSIEYSIGAETMEFLDRQERLRRIRELAHEVGMAQALEAETEQAQVLNYVPDKP